MSVVCHYGIVACVLLDEAHALVVHLQRLLVFLLVEQFRLIAQQIVLALWVGGGEDRVAIYIIEFLVFLAHRRHAGVIAQFAIYMHACDVIIGEGGLVHLGAVEGAQDAQSLGV